MKQRLFLYFVKIMRGFVDHIVPNIIWNVLLFFSIKFVYFFFVFVMEWISYDDRSIGAIFLLITCGQFLDFFKFAIEKHYSSKQQEASKNG